MSKSKTDHFLLPVGSTMTMTEYCHVDAFMITVRFGGCFKPYLVYCILCVCGFTVLSFLSLSELTRHQPC